MTGIRSSTIQVFESYPNANDSKPSLVNDTLEEFLAYFIGDGKNFDNNLIRDVKSIVEDFLLLNVKLPLTFSRFMEGFDVTPKECGEDILIEFRMKPGTPKFIVDKASSAIGPSIKIEVIRGDC